MGGGGGVLNRIKRLMIPYLCWGLIYFIVKSMLHKSIDVEMLVQQFLFGSPACPVMYFIGLLAIFTVLLSLISRLRSQDVIVVVMAISCLAMQYAGWNIAVARCFPKEGAMFVGRCIELFPAAVVGYCFYKHAKQLPEGCWLYVGMLVVGVAGFLFPTCGGYGYQGIGLLSLSAAAFVIIAFFGMTYARNLKLPFIRFAASLTAGIYYMHLLVGWGLERMIGDMGRLATPIVLTVTAISVYVLTKIPYARVLVK